MPTFALSAIRPEVGPRIYRTMVSVDRFADGAAKKSGGNRQFPIVTVVITLLLVRYPRDSSCTFSSVRVEFVRMCRTVAISPEEPGRVYWTKVLIDDEGAAYRVDRTRVQPLAGIITNANTCLRFTKSVGRLIQRY
jgi:hypothetical protein